MKIITLCGSLKFKNEMMTVAEKMALAGYCILTPVYIYYSNLGVNCELNVDQNNIAVIEENLQKR